MSEQPARPPRRARNSVTITGAWMTAASGIIAAVGPQILQAIGFEPGAAQECTTSIVAALNITAAQMVVIGRARANIQPLG